MTSPATGAPQHRPQATRRDNSFWVFAAIGAVALSLAWCWYGMAQIEAETEQGKALVVGQDMAGFAFWTGGVPLIIAHLIGAWILLPKGRKRWPGRGIGYGLIALAAASAIGIGVGELLTGGDLFAAGLHRYYGSAVAP